MNSQYLLKKLIIMRKNYWTKYGITSGLINSSIRLLEIFSRHKELSYNEVMANQNIIQTDLTQSLFFLQDLSLIHVFRDEIVIIEPFEFEDRPELIYKKILKSYIMVFQPVWTNRLHWGVKAVLSDFTLDESHCFKEAGLIDLEDFNVSKWWYSLPVYGNTQNDKSTNGLIGEFLTMDYEESRIGIRPRMMSTESSNHGYDVMSKWSSIESTNKLIEVKTIVNSNNQIIFLSNFEWQTALKNKDIYIFHFWVLKNDEGTAILYEFNVSDLMSHIPLESLSGFGLFDSAKIEVSSLLRDQASIYNSSLAKYKIE